MQLHLQVWSGFELKGFRLIEDKPEHLLYPLQLYPQCKHKPSHTSPPLAMLPSPSREKTKTKVRSKLDEFMSDSGLNESMEDAYMAEIRLGIGKMDFKKVGNWGRL